MLIKFGKWIDYDKSHPRSNKKLYCCKEAARCFVSVGI